MVPAGETDDDEDEARPAPGMLRSSPEEAARAEKAAAEKAAAAAQGPVTPDRMKEFKDKARSEIEERLKDRRKKRRLMRGGDASGGFQALR
jgi:hypothetical protein